MSGCQTIALLDVRNMKRNLFILVLLFWGIGVFGQSCGEVTDKLLSKLNTTSLQTDFSISITEPETQSLNYSGSLLTMGSKFNLRMLTVQAFYDGSTLWVYDRDIDEINISHPTSEELIESNPLLLIKLVRENCRLHFTDTFKDASQWSVDFYPNDKKSPVLKYTVQFNKKDLIPTKIIISEVQNKTTTIILSGQRYGVDTTGKFSLDVKKYPDAMINDLR